LICLTGVNDLKIVFDVFFTTRALNCENFFANLFFGHEQTSGKTVRPRFLTPYFIYLFFPPTLSDFWPYAPMSCIKYKIERISFLIKFSGLCLVLNITSNYIIAFAIY